VATDEREGNTVKIKTDQFGEVEIDEEDIIRMPGGMPGFLGHKRFVIVSREEIWPFSIYQCADDPELSFFIMDPFMFKPDYTVDLPHAVREVGWPKVDADQVKIYTIVNTSMGVPEKITANLLGPLLVNGRAREAVQLVLHNSPYSHRHLIFGGLSHKTPLDGRASASLG
jgi:flagellar assembly factor FliW